MSLCFKLTHFTDFRDYCHFFMCMYAWIVVPNFILFLHFSTRSCVASFFFVDASPAFYCDAQRLPEPWPQFQSRFSDIRNTQRAAAAAAARDAAAAKMDRLLASIDSASGSDATDREGGDGGGEHSGADAAAAENDGTAASDHDSSESSAKRPKLAHAPSSTSSSSPSVCDSV
jgi:hypothetical protein